jgi:hypothetical protein
MKQAALKLNLTLKKTRKQVFFDTPLLREFAQLQKFSMYVLHIYFPTPLSYINS